MADSQDSSLNFSNNSITTRQIEGLIALFEGSGDTWFNFWFDNVCNQNMDNDTKDMLRRNFPRKNYLREIILKLAWSIPLPTVGAAHNDDDDKQATVEELSALELKLTEMQARRNWEGTNDFRSALTWQRCWALVTGDTFVKLPVEPELGPDGKTTGKLVCYPERMPTQRTYIQLDPKIRKVITGYRFMYYLGTGQYTEQGDLSQVVTEIIETDAWKTLEPVKVVQGDTIGKLLAKGEQATAELEANKQWVAKEQGVDYQPPDISTQGILPVAHFAWEQSEESARGIPLALRLVDKILHIMSIKMDRRLGGKFGSVPVYVMENGQGGISGVAPGMVIQGKTEVPFAPFKFSAVGSHFDDKSLKSEEIDAKRELYHEAFLPFEEDKESGAVGDKSGKALQMLSKDQIKYRESFQAAEASYLKELFSKACTLEGLPTDPDDIQIKYDDLISPDAAEQLAEAQFYEGMGLDQKALQVMGVDEDEATTLLQERDDKRAEQMLGGDPKAQLGLDGLPIEAPVPPVKTIGKA